MRVLRRRRVHSRRGHAKANHSRLQACCVSLDMTVPPDDWKRLLQPAAWERLHFEGYYTEARAGRILRGAVPLEPEDRWFIFADASWVFFCRRKSGACIFGIQLHSAVGHAAAVGDSWVTRDKRYYRGTDLEQDRRMLGALIEVYFP